MNVSSIFGSGHSDPRYIWADTTRKVYLRILSTSCKLVPTAILTRMRISGAGVEHGRLNYGVKITNDVGGEPQG